MIYSYYLLHIKIFFIKKHQIYLNRETLGIHNKKMLIIELKNKPIRYFMEKILYFPIFIS